MKRVLKLAGMTLIICAVLFFLIAGIVQEQTKPMKVTTGVMINGEFKATNSGYMGGNAKTQEDMKWLKGIAIMCGVTGTVSLIGSIIFKEEQVY